jgi:adenosylcobinamide kinase/adenosylcobinamide-phosphate guanylyltransferase
MWINNMLYHNYNEKDILQEMDKVCSLQNDIIFVINDVGCSVISENKLTRMFVDINGKVAQLLANRSTNVYNNIAGIQIPLKTS